MNYQILRNIFKKTSAIEFFCLEIDNNSNG